MFIPHHGNEYKPHFFREVAVACMLFVSVFSLGVSFGSSFFLHKTVLGASIASDVLIDLTNESRTEEKEAPLVKNEKLALAAQMKGEDMVTKGYFAHNSPEGVTPWHWFQEAGYSFLYAGENLAINFTDAEDVERAWLNSPKHRANILNASFQEIGIATIPGIYNDSPTIYIVQMFGTPAYVELVPKALATLEPTPKSRVVSGASTTISGSVRGESTTDTKSIEKVGVVSDFLTVKNTRALTSPSRPAEEIPTYSSWYGRILFYTPSYIDTLYTVLTILITFALVTMVVIEIRKQHMRHIFYGLSLLIMVQLFIYINHTFF